MSHCILFVDDEPQILKTFRRVFADTPYNILLASSAHEALELLDKEPVDLLIADVRMPDMDGITLLKTVKERHPQVVRTILSGYADERLIFQSVSQNLAKLYLYKPWQNEQLIQHIERLIHMKDKLDLLKQSDAILTYGDLPTKNNTYQKLMEMLEKNVGINDLVPIIEADLAISSRVMRIANSAFYGMHTNSLRQALVFFGIKYIRELVLTCTLFSSSLSSPLFSQYLEELWQHSILTSRILTGLYDCVLNEKLPEQSHMMSLLHDVGRVAMLDQHPEVFGSLYPNLKNHKTSAALNQETELLGINHEELGGLLLDWWDFPYQVVEGALFHHEPFKANSVNRRLILALHIADRLSWHHPGESLEPLVEPEVIAALGITYDQLNLFMTTVKEIPYAY